MRADKEPPTPRLCVAPTVAQALVAVWHEGPVSVYVTEARRTVPPSGVFDQCLTGERWIIPPVQLSRIGIIPADAVAEAQRGLAPTSNGYLNWARIGQRFVRMAGLVREHLPEARERWVEQFAERSAEYLEQRYRNTLVPTPEEA